MVIMYQRDSTEILEVNSISTFSRILGLSDRKIYIWRYLGCLCIVFEFTHIILWLAKTKLSWAILSIVLRNEQELQSGIFIRDFMLPGFNVSILAQMPLLSATLRQGVERGTSILRQRVRDYDSISQWTKLQFSSLSGWIELIKERRSNNLRPWL